MRLATLACALFLSATSATDHVDRLGKFTKAGLEEKLHDAHDLDEGSSIFLGTRYRHNSPFKSDAETLVIDLSGMDCFTFLDYSIAAAGSDDYDSFVDEVRHLRYANGEVDYDKRNHFFTQWIDNNDVVEDITGTCDEAVVERRALNRRPGGIRWVPGLPVMMRDIEYIPTSKVAGCADTLREGSIVGFVPRPYKYRGLDVRHTGILIHEGDRIVLRHSSQGHRVKDEDFLDYLKHRSGLFRGVIIVKYKP